MGRSRLRARNVIILLVFVSLIAFFMGYNLGVIAAISGVVKVASNFVSINYDEVHMAIFQYQERIGGCYNNSLPGVP